MPEISRVGVLGCGLMGSGIAQAAATAGFPTVGPRRRAGLLAKGERAIRAIARQAGREGEARRRRAATARWAPQVHH